MSHRAAPAHSTAEARRQWELGRRHAKAERWASAVVAHAKAARLAPNDALYALNHARAMLASGQTQAAGEEALRAFTLDADFLTARDFVVECLVRQQRYADIVTLLRGLAPEAQNDRAFHTMLGSALQRLGRPTDAIAALFDALALQPDNAGLHHNLGLCFNDLDMKQEAAQCFNTALLLGVGVFEPLTRGLACFADRGACNWQDHATRMAALRAAGQALPPDAKGPTAPFAHLAFCDDAAEQLAVARSAARHTAHDVQPLPAQRSDWQPGQRRLRVGYVSADFHAHATAILISEMLEQHDRSRFHIHLYSHGPDDRSPMRQRIEAACETFVEVRELSDRAAAERMRADGIDLLIDLKGHTRDARLAIFAYRAAPLQASFLGYPGSTGADYIDYVVGDPVVTPQAHAADYTEQIAQLPVCYQPNDRQRQLPPAPTRASQGLPDDALVLSVFNQPYKLSPEAFDVWCDLLHTLPQAVLWVLEWAPQALPNLRREAAARGIDPTRVIGAPRLPPAEHLARFRLADLFLDTWPYGAHTTASDALWAGVPVVTVAGRTFASRVGASLLGAVGLPELVCHDIPHYKATVQRLAACPAQRAALQARLAAAREHAALFDSLRFTRDIEALYLRMAERQAQGLAPAQLLAQPA